MDEKKISVLGGYVPDLKTMEDISGKYFNYHLAYAIQVVRALIEQGLHHLDAYDEYSQDFVDGFSLYGSAVIEILDKAQAILDGTPENIDNMYYFDDKESEG